jgi:hypothetical protein
MKKEEVVAGAKVRIESKKDPVFGLKGLIAWPTTETVGLGEAKLIVPNEEIELLTKPRRVQGINLVKLKYNNVEFEAYYINVKKHTLI